MSRIVIDGSTITVLPSTAYVMTVHDADECAGRTCVIHSLTDHQMRNLQLHWRADRGIFERICPHGYGHPDPDQRAYWRHVASTGRSDYVAAQMTHGCDGCCMPVGRVGDVCDRATSHCRSEVCRLGCLGHPDDDERRG